VCLVVAPGVRDEQRLEDATNRLSGVRLQRRVEVVAHEAVAIKAERIPQSGLVESVEEGGEVFGGEKDGGKIIPPVEGVIDQTIGYRSREA
jgi:hypothetical protein